MKKKIGYILLIILVGIQFIRTDQDIIEYQAADDFLVQTNAPENIRSLLKASCYDCHSNTTTRTWYGEIAPVSWYINDHINEGKKELNFSTWGAYKLKSKKHKLEEAWEEIEKGKMPLEDYLRLHDDASLSEEEQKLIIKWLKSIDLDSTEENTLSLNSGQKWVPNIETSDGIRRMLSLLNKDTKDSTFSQYSVIGKNLNLEMKTIFSECTMTGEGHNQLHNFLLPLVKQFRELENSKTVTEGDGKIKLIHDYLDNYTNYFN